jgi:hypothetical protein
VTRLAALLILTALAAVLWQAFRRLNHTPEYHDDAPYSLLDDPFLVELMGRAA